MSEPAALVAPPTPVDALGETGRKAASGAVPFRRRLSTRLLFLTVIFVMIAEILIFPPSLANFRLQWLQQRVTTAAAVSIALLRTGAGPLDKHTQLEILRASGVTRIAVRDGNGVRLLAGIGPQPDADLTVDLSTMEPVLAIFEAAQTLFEGERMLRVIGTAGDTGRIFEIFVVENGLKRAMLLYARNIAILSLIISAITATLVFAAINRAMIRPIRRLRTAMLTFADAPEDQRRIIVPSGRTDELGTAERELAAVQTQLNRTLGERKRLAELGLAVAKINHDMRNILASAQLISDRLQFARDPIVQAFAPKLVRALDRAVDYSRQVIAYGAAKEPPPARRRLPLHPLIEDVHGLLGVDPESGIELINAVHEHFEVDADSEQLFRVISNLGRNAVQAMATDETGDKRLTVGAERIAGICRILITDTGPGLPQKARENLFAAFRGSARSGGTGLGLAIAFELIRAHGGDIELLESAPGKTVFAVSLPDPPGFEDAARPALRKQA